jgi:hypothetical protein
VTTETHDYHPHPRNPRTELRVLHLSTPGKDYLADAWNGKLVLVTGWFPSWTQTNEACKEGKPVWRIHWKAKCMELPDRFFHESELVRPSP